MRGRISDKIGEPVDKTVRHLGVLGEVLGEGQACQGLASSGLGRHNAVL